MTIFKKIPSDTLKLLVFFGFLTTGWISFQLVATLCNSVMDYVIAFNMTFVMQFGSFFFYERAVNNKKSKFRNWSIAVSLFIISIVATTALNVNLVNEVRNELVLNSKGYESKQKDEFKKEQIIELKKDEIVALQNELEYAIAGIDSSIELKKGEIQMWQERERKENELYYGQIGRVKNEIAALEKDKIKVRQNFADKVQLANDDLGRAYENSLSTNSSNEVEIEIQSTKGYLGLIIALCNWFKIDFDKAMLLTQLAIAVIFEITIISFHVEHSQRKLENSKPKSPESLIQAGTSNKPKEIKAAIKKDNVKQFPKIKNMNINLQKKLKLASKK